VQLLAGTEESARSDGIVYYSFPAAVRGIIRESSQYAWLQKQVMFAFSSKYALALYEMVQKRGNMKFKTSEEFPVDRFRSLLGVEDGKLQAFKSFKQRAIDPAVLEVNGLGEFGCKVEPSAYAGRKVTAVRLSWWAKNLDERKNALNELRFSRGRPPRPAEGRGCDAGTDRAAAPPTPRCCRSHPRAGASGTPTPICCRHPEGKGRADGRGGEGGPPQDVAVGQPKRA
jgi:Initiator Replication protein